MPRFCDVALPVPLDQGFTYRLQGAEPAVGARVVVPFRNQKLSGIVVAVHDNPPPVEAKLVLSILDTQPVLNDQLLELGRWISSYYIAPIGEVYRTMLPLSAEFRRAHGYRITDKGQDALYASAEIGSSLRARKDTEHQMLEYAVLNHLADGEVVREQSLRSATGATRDVFRTMVNKKWIVREDLSAVRDASRTVPIAVLKEITGKLNANQQAILLALKATGGR